MPGPGDTRATRYWAEATPGAPAPGRAGGGWPAREAEWSQQQALTWGLPSGHLRGISRPGPAQQARSRGQAVPWAPEDGLGLSHLTLPTAQGPRTEPGLDFTDRNGGSPSTPTLHWAGSSAGLAYLGWGGRGWTPQERYNTGSLRGRC